ncbi:MAG: DUF1059 domain-containing protein [Candidatus Thermoplasmatota archaeon]|nr:DUF1059 domain-containing protein [Candidatus Thermoplasmatota archaeon]MCL5730661.1 DUF1059 domain-containing protein [Candidatus Thermoplasmatota archaeon]
MVRYHFKCRDVGYSCSYELDQGQLKDMMPSIKIHMKYAHQIWEMTKDLEDKINSAITKTEEKQ